jgi:glutathione S-transferase
MKLYYFGMAGRAETSRIMLRAAGTKFEDVCFDRASWEAKYKAKAPTRQCPFLELDNGDILSQSIAINVYVANITGFMPSDAVQQARTLEILATFEEVSPTCCTYFSTNTI